jgi:hypothetical protein
MTKLVAAGLLATPGITDAGEQPTTAALAAMPPKAVAPKETEKTATKPAPKPAAATPAPIRQMAEWRPNSTIVEKPAATPAATPAVQPAAPTMSAVEPTTCAPALSKSCKQKLRDYYLEDRLGVMPLGAMVEQPFREQVANGYAARMTLYDYDFVCGTDRLNQRGKDRVRQMGCWMRQCAYPIVVERTIHQPDLAEARRIAVMNEFAEAAIHLPPERVVVAKPVSIPQNGVEAILIYENFLIQTRQFGYPTYRQLILSGNGGSSFGSGGGFGIGGNSGNR